MDEPGKYIQVSWDKFSYQGGNCNFDYISQGDELKGQVWKTDEFVQDDDEMCGFILYFTAEDCGSACADQDKSVSLYTYKEGGFGEGALRLSAVAFSALSALMMF